MSILIKNGLVYDGSERPPEKKDILVSGKKIVRVEKNLKHKAERILEANGAMVTPGFIDIGSTLDHYFEIFSAAVQQKLISQGITTLIGGNNGFSLAPFTKKFYSLMNEMGDNHYRNVDWHSVKDFLKVLGRKHLHVNFGTLTGHTTIRESLTKGERRDLTDHELIALERILNQSFKDGAFGLSLESFYSQRIPFYEIKVLAASAARAKMIFALGLRHTKEKLKEAIQEAMTLTKETLVNVQIRHFAPLKNFVLGYLEAKDLFEKYSAETRINFDLNPLGITVVPIDNLLPNWFQKGSWQKTMGDLENSAMKERFFSDFAKFDLSKIKIIRTPKSLKSLEGKTIRDFAASRNLYDAPAILKFMQTTNLQALVGLENVDLKTMKEFINSPKSIVSADVLTDSFVSLINLISKDNFMPLEKAVAKMTFGPAQKYKISSRGLLKEGYFADLNVISEGKIKDVVLNGELVFEDGRSQNKAAGAVLKPAR